MEKTVIFAGPASAGLARQLGELLAAPVVQAHERTFPDGETCASGVIDARFDRVILVQGTHPPQDRHLQQLFQMIESAGAQGDFEIICVVPYLAYSRQDRRSRPGEPLSAAVVLRILRMLGVTELVTVDVHNPGIFEDAELDWASLSAAHPIAEQIRSLALRAPIMVSPDAGGERRTRLIGERLHYPTVVLAKRKANDGTTTYDQIGQEVVDRDAVVVDDLSSSGSTLIPLVAALREAGARTVTVIVTHLFADIDGLRSALGDDVRLLSTDSIPSPASVISLASLIAGYLTARRAGHVRGKAA